MTFFANLPVADLDRSRTFYAALGWPTDERYANENAARFVIADGVRLMLSSRGFFDALGGGRKTVADPATTSLAAFAFDLPSREAVDALVGRAEAAGGRVGPSEDHGFMYQRDFEDLDGHQFAPFWMDPAGPPRPA